MLCSILGSFGCMFLRPCTVDLSCPALSMQECIIYIYEKPVFEWWYTIKCTNDDLSCTVGQFILGNQINAGKFDEAKECDVWQVLYISSSCR